VKPVLKEQTLTREWVDQIWSGHARDYHLRAYKAFVIVASAKTHFYPVKDLKSAAAKAHVFRWNLEENKTHATTEFQQRECAI